MTLKYYTKARLTSRLLYRTVSKTALGAAFFFFSTIVSANPFLPQFGISLGDMNRDGDLIMRLPITGLTTQAGDLIEVTLEHRQETSDYGELQSRFVLRPFETGIGEQQGEVRWQALYGEDVIFLEKRRETESPDLPPLPVMENSVLRWTCLKGADNVRLWWSASALAVIEYAKWNMIYRNGGLSEIKSPQGAEIMVTSSGRRSSEWREGNKALGRVKWREASPVIVHTPNGDYIFELDERGRVIAVKDGKIKIEVLKIHYAYNGLVDRVWTLSGGELTIGWRANEGYGNGASFYRKPYSIARVGNVKYRYHRDGDNVRMEMTSGDGSTRVVHWKSINGKIVSVTGN